ncbi:MAG: hypothetical protein ACE5JA_09115, partial [bacterium]
MSRLHEIGQWAFNTAPPIAEMRGHPEFESWGEQLVALGRSEGLAPLQNLLEDIVGDALTTLNPLNRFLGQQAHILPLDTYWRA